MEALTYMFGFSLPAEFANSDRTRTVLVSAFRTGSMNVTRPENISLGYDSVVTRTVCSVKYSFDERVEDGLYCARSLELLRRRIEDPASWLPEA